jgi:hypothetical protein
MSTPAVTFITYTKGTRQYVTTPYYETQFLNWLNSVDNSSGYVRETNDRVSVTCCPRTVYAEGKKEAIILKLVKDDQ